MGTSRRYANTSCGRSSEPFETALAPRLRLRPPVGPHELSIPAPIANYLLGQAALSRRAQSIEASANLFRRAVAKDSLFANAWSGLSLARALAPYFQPTPTREVAGEVTTAAQRALQLDPSLAQPHIALGLVHEHAYRWTRAESDSRRRSAWTLATWRHESSMAASRVSGSSR